MNADTKLPIVMWSEVFNSINTAPSSGCFNRRPFLQATCLLVLAILARRGPCSTWRRRYNRSSEHLIMLNRKDVFSRPFNHRVLEDDSFVDQEVYITRERKNTPFIPSFPMWKSFFCWIYALVYAFFASFITYLGVFRLYLAIQMRKQSKKVKEKKKKKYY